MIIYLIKSILCSAILFSIYYFLLRGEKMYQFNRFYLLGAVILSLVIPTLTFQFQSAEYIPFAETAVTYTENQASSLLPIEVSTNEESFFPNLIITVYAVIVILLFARFIKNLIAIIRKSSVSKAQTINDCKLIVVPQKIIPHTFLSYIFISTEDSTNTQIITHELTHAQQKHTLDILFIEFIQCLFWFNPVLILYKKAIRINHEFIADHAVVEAGSSTVDYQQLLIQQASKTSFITLASSFSYSTTKKRFMMMTALKNRKRSIIKMIMVSLTIPALAFVLSEKTYSQTNNSKSSSITQDTIATPAMITEFEQLVSKYEVTNKKMKLQHIALNVTDMTNDDRERMKEIYEAMTPQQKSKYPEAIIYVHSPAPPVKKTPTAEELQDWIDPKMYGVWLDGNRINNAELKKYKPSDIAHTSESRLLKNAAHYGQYKFQVNLMTHAYYDKTYPPKSN